MSEGRQQTQIKPAGNMLKETSPHLIECENSGRLIELIKKIFIV